MEKQINNEVEILNYLVGFFKMINYEEHEDFLISCKSHEGFHLDYVHLFFKKSLEGLDWDLYEKFNEREIRLEYDLVGPEGIYMYISFETFYSQLKNWIEEKYKNNSDLLDLLKEVKTSLGC